MSSGKQVWKKDWSPRTDEERAYYGLTSSTQNNSSGLYLSLIEPLLVTFGLSVVRDASYGRRDLPLSPSERALRAKPGIVARDATVYITKPKEKGSVDSKKSAPAPLHSVKGDAFVQYQVYYDESAPKQRNADLVFVHGLNDYGGKFTRHAERFLRAGYRLILPDLPSHGRSSGLHAYVNAIHAVICDLRHQDAINGDKRKRKLFIGGQSMGGFTSLAYAVKYPPHRPQSSPYAIEKDSGPRPVIDGLLVLCPMLAIAPETRPSYALELVARAVSSFAGRVAYAEANKGKESNDPNVSAEFDADPQGYHGYLRVATGLGILKGIDEVNAKLGEITVPLFIRHGDADRVTAHHGSETLFQRVLSKDKDFKLVPGGEHILLKQGRDEQDDKPRQEMLNLMLNWLNTHA